MVLFGEKKVTWGKYPVWRISLEGWKTNLCKNVSVQRLAITRCYLERKRVTWGKYPVWRDYLKYWKHSCWSSWGGLKPKSLFLTPLQKVKTYANNSMFFSLFANFQPTQEIILYIYAILGLPQKVQHQTKSLDNLRNWILTIRRNLMNYQLTTNRKFYMTTLSRKISWNYFKALCKKYWCPTACNYMVLFGENKVTWRKYPVWSFWSAGWKKKTVFGLLGEV